MSPLFALLLLSFLGSFVTAVPTLLDPVVQLDNGTFIGTSTGFTHRFLGIPFAKAPVGQLRFNLPVAVDAYTGTHNAQNYGPACPQQALDATVLPDVARIPLDIILNDILKVVSPAAEDCLSVNVVVPTGVQRGANLPVLVWIYGGGFELGGSNLGYDGDVIVERSVALGEPVIFVSLNYRLSAYGFLGSQEVKEAGVGNLGLQDQRLAFRWVQKYISAFGGDPTKVTIWGESAGAISVALHMLTNGVNTEGLFRGAFMQSGSLLPVGDITHGQQYYDAIVKETNCSGRADTLQCLREVPYDALKRAVDMSPNLLSYQSLNLAYLPRVDGKFLVDVPFNLVSKGIVANVPFVIGDCDDEGTIFSLVNLNATYAIGTDAPLRTYLLQNYCKGCDPSVLDDVLRYYPEDPTQGSPFDTGHLNELTPQFKRMAAIQGDLVFQGPRRFFLQERADKQPAWSFMYKRGKLLPLIGSGHATDVANIFYGGDLTNDLVNFANKLDPNGNAPEWPPYTNASPKMMVLFDGLFDVPSRTIGEDDFRVEGMEALIQVMREHPI